MQHDWILDVLGDLKVYAVSNGLSAVADQLEDAKITAMAELASAIEGGPAIVRHEDHYSAVVEPIGASRRA